MSRARRAQLVPRRGLAAWALPGGAVLLAFDVAAPSCAASELPPACARVAELASQGLSDRAIARRLGRSRHTVSNLLRRAYRRLGVHGRRELAVALTRRSCATSCPSGASRPRSGAGSA